MLDLRQLTAGATLLLTLGITAASTNALAPTNIESPVGQYFGDCPAGCSERTTWTFHAYPDGMVQFAGHSGNAPPPPRDLPSGIEGRSTSSRMPGIIRRNPDGTEERVEPTISPSLIPIAVLDQAGRQLTRIEPDEKGYFRVALPPGTYTLAPEIRPSNYFVLSNRRDELQSITVTEGQFTPIQIKYTQLIP